MKKVLSLVLVIAMILSSFSFAFAADFEDVEGDYEEAVNVLTALGVVTGYEDGTYRPERIVTRAEMAKLIVEILGYGDLVAGAKSNFADTQGHWADAWIALAAGRGLVIGDGDGNFRPDAQVSYDEAITMVVRALGYTDNSNELKGMTWPTNFKVKASELDLLDGLKTLAGGADRGGVAQLLFNALDATLVTVDTDGNIVYVKDAEKKDMPLLSRLADKVELKPVNTDHVDPDHKNYKGDVVDLIPYMYQNITVYEKDDVVVFVKSVDSLTLEGTVLENNANKIKVEDAKEKEFEFDLDNNVDLMYNGGEANYVVDGEVVDLEDAEVILVLGPKGEGVVEAGDRIDTDIQKVTAMIVRKATATVQAEEDFDEDEVEILAYPENVVLPLDDDEIDYDKVVVKGDADSLEDIEKDDVLTLFYAGGAQADDVKLEIVVSKETVEGKVTRITVKDGEIDKVYIDGKAYSLSDDYDDDEIAVKDEGTFFLDYEGKIFAVETESDLTPDNYALVLDVTNGYAVLQNQGEANEELVVLRDAKVKVLTAKGETVTYVLDHDDLLEAEEPIITIITNELAVQLEEGNLIKYDLNKDGEIDEAELVEGTLEEGLKTTVNKFNLAKNAAIFSVPRYEKEDNITDGAKVIDADILAKEIDAYVVNNEDGEIVALIVVKGAGAVEDDIYGIITDNTTLTLDEDDEEVVVYTVYVDGEEVEYLGIADEDVIDDLNVLVRLTISNGRLEEAEVVDETDEDVDMDGGTASGDRITKSIKDTEGETYYLADDVVIYVLEGEDGPFDEVGTKSDIRNKEFLVYDVNQDGDYDIVVVWPVAEGEES